jgi:hypothetical protein
MVGAGKGASAQVTLEWLGAGVLPEVAGQLVRPAHQHILSVTNGRRIATVMYGEDGFLQFVWGRRVDAVICMGGDRLPLYCRGGDRLPL